MDATTWGPVGTVVAGMLVIVANYVRERRKDRARDDVAEATVPDRIDVSSATAYDARLMALTKTWDGERASLERQVTAADQRAQDAEAREARKHAELIKVLGEIERMRGEMDRMRVEMESLQDQLRNATRRMSELLDEDVRHAAEKAADDRP